MNQKIYIGPSKPYKLPLMTNAIIIDMRGIAGLSEALAEHKELASLMIPISDLGVARMRVKEKGDPLYEAYHKVLTDTAKIRGGK